MTEKEWLGTPTRVVTHVYRSRQPGIVSYVKNNNNIMFYNNYITLNNGKNPGDLFWEIPSSGFPENPLVRY